MADNWRTLNLSTVLPSEVVNLTSTANTVTESLTSLLTLIKTGLQIAQTTAASASSNPIESAIGEAIDELENNIEGLLSNTSAHAILIPIQKQRKGKGVRLPSEEVPSSDIPSSISDLVEEGAFSGQKLSNILTDTRTFVNTSSTAVGGNQGFWKELMLSLNDEGDDNKPQFPSNYAVTGSCIILGSEDLSSLQESIDFLTSLIKVSYRSDPASRTRPVMKELKAKVIPVPTEDPPTIGVQLDWPAIPPIKTLPLFGGERQKIKEIFVIRSTDSSLREKFSWKELFSRAPNDSSSDLQEEGKTRVVARITNDGFVKRYVDTSVELDAKTTYYYTTALRYEMGGTTQPMGPLAPVKKVTGNTPKTSKQSEAPDWSATPTLIEIFPAFHTVLSRLKLTIAKLRSRSVSNSGISSMIEQTIEQLDAIIDQAEEEVQELTEILDRVNALLNSNIAGVHATTISVNRGGTSAWVAELAKRLSDTSDPSRPPYTDGGEFVTGLVVMAGAPRPPSLEAIKSLLSLFFGGAEDNKLLDALKSVEKEVKKEESLIFGDDLQGDRDQEPAEEKDTKGFDDSLKPTDKVVC